MSLDHKIAELLEVVERDMEDQEALLQLARLVARADDPPEFLDREELREALAKLFLTHPREQALWQLVLLPLGFQVLGKDSHVGDWWAANDRLGEAEGHLFDRETGLPLALRRWEDGAEMLLVPALRGLESAYWLDRFPVTRAQWRWIVAQEKRGPPPGWLAPPAPEPAPPQGWLDRLASLLAPPAGPRGPDRRPAVLEEGSPSREYHYKVQGDLPPAALWELAARGTDGRPYPWGDAAPTAQHASCRGTTGRLVPVDATAKSAGPFGHRDLVGNTMEILDDTRDSDNPMSNKSYRSLAGSDYRQAPACGTTSWRYTRDPAPGVLGLRLAVRASFLPIWLRYLDRRPAPWQRPPSVRSGGAGA